MSITYTYGSNTMYLHTLKVHSNIDVTYVEHICESNQEFIHCSLAFYDSRFLLITLMKAYDVIVHIKIHCTIDITYVEHICESNQEYIHCSLSFYGSRCLLILLMKALRCIVQITGSLYF